MGDQIDVIKKIVLLDKDGLGLSYDVDRVVISIKRRGSKNLLCLSGEAKRPAERIVPDK